MTRWHRVRCRAFELFAMLVLLAGCRCSPSGTQSQSCVTVDSGYGVEGKVPVRAETVATHLEVPWSVVFFPDGDLLVTERRGWLRIVHDGKPSAPIAKVPVGGSGEGGLLGAVAHPEFADNHLFYLYYTAEVDGQSQNRVERWRLSSDRKRAGRERTIIEGIPAAKYHDGGRLRFGPDGKLYVGTGDAREPELSQSRDSLAGKILRLEPDGSIPADNPFTGSPVFMLGIRNTQAFDWLGSDTLLVMDHGPSGEMLRFGHDELNVARARANLGWPTIWGCEAKSGMVSPALTWDDAVPPGGAAIYRGDEIPEWKGSVLIGTLGSKHLHRAVLDKSHRVVEHEVYFQGDPPDGLGRLREVIMGPDGHLYVTTSNCDSRGECPADRDRILRIRSGR